MAITYPHTVPAEQAFMGKARTYSAQTNFRQYAVRLQALVDNPRNPNITGAIGTDWAVDDPSAIVEEGSNSNGSYVIFANNEVAADSPVLTYTEHAPGWSTRDWTFPIQIITPPKVLGQFGITFRGIGGGDGVCAFVQSSTNRDVILSSRNFIDTAQRNINTGKGYLRAMVY